jgi:hypothetical protein
MKRLRALQLPDACLERIGDAFDAYQQHRAYVDERPGAMQYQDNTAEIRRLAQKLHRKLTALSAIERQTLMLHGGGLLPDLRQLKISLKRLEWITETAAKASKTDRRLKRALTRKRHDRSELAREVTSILTEYGFTISRYRGSIAVKILAILLDVDEFSESPFHAIRNALK